MKLVNMLIIGETSSLYLFQVGDAILGVHFLHNIGLDDSKDDSKEDPKDDSKEDPKEDPKDDSKDEPKDPKRVYHGDIHPVSNSCQSWNEISLKNDIIRAIFLSIFPPARWKEIQRSRQSCGLQILGFPQTPTKPLPLRPSQITVLRNFGESNQKLVGTVSYELSKQVKWRRRISIRWD